MDKVEAITQKPWVDLKDASPAVGLEVEVKTIYNAEYKSIWNGFQWTDRDGSFMGEASEGPQWRPIDNNPTCETVKALIEKMRCTGLMPIASEKPLNRFTLTESEQKAFNESGSTSIRFDTGSGIGVAVSYYLNEKDEWVDITDYSTW